jgi:glutaredoxin
VAKEFFREKGITYREFDVGVDIQARKRMVEESGQLGVPVVLVDGEMVIGFDRERLEKLLGIT